MDSFMTSVLPFALIIAVFYFLMIRPEGKKKKAAQIMRSSLAVGDRIVTIGGITGTVCSTKDDSVVFETGADRVRVEVMRWAISAKETAAEAPAADDPGELKP